MLRYPVQTTSSTIWIDVLYVAGPGHGGPALVANTWLEGSYSELYPNIPRDAEGMQRLFRQFSFPGGVGSHVTAEAGPLAAAWRGSRTIRQTGPRIMLFVFLAR